MTVHRSSRTRVLLIDDDEKLNALLAEIRTVRGTGYSFIGYANE